jgi:hypothetical protein
MVIRIALVLLLAGCSQTIIQYPSVCTADDATCKRNLNARTLHALGYEEAAIELMCTESTVRGVVGECSDSPGHSR